MLTSQISIFRARSTAVAAVLLMLMTLSAGWSTSALAADSYLDAIQEEASDLKVDSAVGIDEPNTPQAADAGIPADLDQGGFENLLRARYIGSFMFYNKLSDADKKAVYDEYTSSKDIEVIRKKIIALFSSR